MAYNSSNKLPKANEQIDAKEVRVIDDNGEMLGIMPIDKAIKTAKDKGLDLVEISPNAEPPVCKFLDFGRYKFEQQRKKNDGKKKQKKVQLKEIKVRPTIDTHDYEVKMRSLKKFINAGDKVKISLRFRGREITHNELGMDLMKRIIEDSSEIAKVELEPRMDGRQILMILLPK
ncbi:MAG: translation initiation factor IF-3 [Rickettsiales bacterium]|nr:translation initiation factor IF-3 [Pseudomonadota bacterium]MDA0967197.1 translation initiation factor IF-3 [Pseudomonadota bacterium]MDG4544142.1 translation initiation factor IF-3 [Rickettsiales bacterium]MDG4546323.1 translation initiation factor IF-3 [Rickettsiales bacterium]MDG4548466.1 translation initiation factor IF-3 [Rickettsiales bacterium]